MMNGIDIIQRILVWKSANGNRHGGSRYGLSYGPVRWGARSRVPRGSHRLWI